MQNYGKTCSILEFCKTMEYLSFIVKFCISCCLVITHTIWTAFTNVAPVGHTVQCLWDRKFSSTRKRSITHQYILVTYWNVWKERNDRIFRNTSHSIETCMTLFTLILVIEHVFYLRKIGGTTS